MGLGENEVVRLHVRGPSLFVPFLSCNQAWSFWFSVSCFLARAAAPVRRDKIGFVGGAIAPDDVSTFEKRCEEEEEEDP